MRIENSLKNMFFGITGQFIGTVLGFLVRTIFIYTLGIHYLGIEGLFTSILLMFSLANLGFDTAMIYSLYKPLAQKDQYQIQAYMNLYKKAYKIIGFVILVIGLIMLPFIPFLITGEAKIENLYTIYIIFLLHSVSSYYFVYKQSILIADQKSHLISKVHILFSIVSSIIQILFLLLLGMYIPVLIAQLGIKVVENVYLGRFADKLYPYLREKTGAKLSIQDKKEFTSNLYSLFLYKVSGVVINGTDNIIISKFVGISWIGLYSNYFLIITTINSFLSSIFYSVTASIGNLNAEEDQEKKYFIFRVMNFANFWIYGICTICLWNLINPVITFWLGESFLLSKIVVFSILLNFLTSGFQNATTTYRETTGLFKKGKYRPLYAAIINVIVSIFLANKIGLSGVFFGTIISRLCTYFWYDPYVIYKYVFKRSVASYFIRYLLNILLIASCALLVQYLGEAVKFSFLMNLFILFLISVLLPNIIFFLLFYKTEEFTYIASIFLTMLRKAGSHVERRKVRQEI